MANGFNGCKFTFLNQQPQSQLKSTQDVISPFSDSKIEKPPPIMALSTSEVSQMVFSMLENPLCLIWSFPKNCLSVRLSQGNFDRLGSFRCLYRFIKGTVYELPMSPIESLRIWSSPSFIRRFQRRFFSSHWNFQVTCLNTNCNILVIEWDKYNLQKS